MGKELLKDVDVPAMGQEFEFAFPAQLKEQLDSVRAYLQAKVDAGEASSDDAKEVFLQAAEHFSKVYKSTLEQIDADVVASKEFFSAVPDAGKYKTKADVLRALRAELKDSPLAEIEEKLPIRRGAALGVRGDAGRPGGRVQEHLGQCRDALQV